MSIKNSCPKCGNQNFKVIVYSDTVDFRNMELDVENLEESKCESCGYKWESGGQRAHNESIIRASYAVMRDKIRKEQGLLSGDKIAEIREKFSLSQREAAALFGGGYNAFNKYESGEVLQSFAMDRLLRLTNVVGQPAIDFLQNVYKQPNFKVISSNKEELTVLVVKIGGHSLFGTTLETIGTSRTQQIQQHQNFTSIQGASFDAQKRPMLN